MVPVMCVSSVVFYNFYGPRRYSLHFMVVTSGVAWLHYWELKFWTGTYQLGLEV